MAVHRLVWRFSSFPMPVVKVEQRPPVTASMYSTVEKEMLLSNKSITTPADDSRVCKLPILLFDIMDTVVRDPFYHDIPTFFGMPMKELLQCKHPTAWIEFEKGLITEVRITASWAIANICDSLGHCLDALHAGRGSIDYEMFRIYITASRECVAAGKG